MPPSGGIDRRVLIGMFAVLFAGGAAVLSHQWLARQRMALDTERKKVMANYQAPIEVVVATKDLPEDTLLEPSHLRLATVPEKFVQPYAIRSPQELVGKLTAVPIAKDEQILANKIRRPEEAPRGSTLSSVTPKGKRAVTISVDTLSGVGGFIRPGDLVDILWTIKLPDAVQTLTVFQDVPVLAIGGEMIGRAAAKAAPGEKASNDFAVTLALSPQETSFLLFAREQGRIQLSLRSKTDEGKPVAVVPANINTLLEMQLGLKSKNEGATAGAEPSEKSGVRQVEVYRGLKRDLVSLPEGN